MSPVSEPSILATLIQRCTATSSLAKARQLHAVFLTLSTSNVQTPYVNNNILSMYARCGSLLDAQRLFDKMPERNIVSYNALITAYSRNPNYAILGFNLFTRIGIQGLRPNGLTFTSILQACCSLENWFMGSLIHAQVLKFGFLNDVCVQTSLLGMYSNCDDLESACKVFGSVLEKDVILWNSMILGKLKNDKIREGLRLFGAMVRSGVIPTLFTYSMVLSACAKLGYFCCGQALHARLTVWNILVDLPLQNSLLDMYCSCGDIKTAFKVFSRIEKPDLVSWNSIISGCAENGKGDEAMGLFVQLLGTSHPKPDEYTYVAVIYGTGSLMAADYGQPLHAQVMKVGLHSSVFIGATLLSMYFRNSDAESAQEVFNLIKEKDVVLWTEMIMGYTRLGDGENAVNFFCKMCQDDHKSDSFALSGVLSACADLATLKQGEMLHAHALKTGCGNEMSVRGSLIDMYAKNGNLQAAQSIFSQVLNPDIKCWNSMIGGYSFHGMAKEAMGLFEEILEHGLRPDHVTFLSLLSACSHSGWVGKGKFLWNYMKENGVVPSSKHHSCMVTLLSRAGLLDEAEEIICGSTYSEEQLQLWRTLLSSCVHKRNLRIGLRAGKEALRINPEDGATHILLSNLYAFAGIWDGVAEMRRKIRELMLEKDPGLSWIEAKDDIHVFSSSDQLNTSSDEAQAEMHRLQGNMLKSVNDEIDANSSYTWENKG